MANVVFYEGHVPCPYRACADKNRMRRRPVAAALDEAVRTVKDLVPEGAAYG